jgi:type I restriction enzyme S subunit
VKKGWQAKTLGEVCVVDKCQGSHKNLPYVGLEHIESHTGRFLGSTEPVGVKSSTFKFSQEHVLYGRLRPYLNKVMLPDFTGHCSTEIFPFKPRPGLSREFLQYWFLRDATVEQIDATSTGTRMPRANMNAVLDFEFPFPPLPEQQRIVGILDEAFAGIATAKANAEKNLQNARALFESHLQSVFTQRGPGWITKSLEGLATIRTGKRDANHQVEDGPYPFYTCAFGQFRSPTFSFDGASIILPGNGANVGKVFFYDGKFEAYQRTYVVNELSDAINPRFLFFCFSAGWPGYIANKQFGSATNYIVVGDLKAFPVPTPPSSVQAATVERLESFSDETQRLAALYERKLAVLEALKKSLLHQAFTGQL